MSLIPTIWCPYCDSANELNAKHCWHCRQWIPAGAERTGVPEPMPALPAYGTAETQLVPVAVDAYPYPVMPLATLRAYAAEGERKQCVYCREWIDPQASVCPFCRTDQGAIAAVQRATWSFVQLFFCFAAVGVGVVVLIRICQWGLTGGASG
jgi:thiol-disulfide isomerase/thioredoxin